MLRFATLGLLAASLISALPSPRSIPDAPYSVDAATLENAITCPFGIKGKKGGVVLLVHGTGSTGSESWKSGPYVQVLPTVGKGYDVCWIDLPNRSLVDAQLSATYVAYAISSLSSKSSTRRISVIGHSQGSGLNIQWALQFYPSLIPLVQNYIGLAPDFKGTAESLLLCRPGLGALGVPTCAQSVWQQTVGSRYLKAQNSMLAGGGGRALVPTTAILTITDDVIQPEFPRAIATSNLEGASVHGLQDLDYCGVAHIADHFTMIIDSAAFGLVVATLEAGAPVPMSKFDKTYCLINKNDPIADFSTIPALVAGALADVVALGTGADATEEPPLQPYVCQRGFATECGPAFA